MKLNRRSLLRGSCQGAMAVMGLPFLDCFLNSKGQAQTNGRPLPTRFNTFFWGCGLTHSLWIPKTAGTGWEMTVQLKPLEPYREKLNLFSGLRVPLDSKPNGQHWSGLAAAITGIAPARGGEFESKTIDQQVAEVIGKGVRFQSVAASSSGDPRQSYSSLGGSNALPSEPTPLSLYTRLFGPGFQDPTKGDWKPDPRIMMQKSVLSAVAEDRHRIMQNLDAGDRARMDQYFTSVRQTELQMEAELQRPTIEAKVSIPDPPSKDLVANNAWPNLEVVTPLMARLGAIALATDQTRVFNLSVSSPQNQMFRPGDPLGFHQSTHEEGVDPKLGYQPRVAQYNLESMQLFAALLKELDAIREGDGTLLDHSLVMAFTDQSYARIHSVDGLPILVAGGASGRMKTGYHIVGDNSPVSRVGLTLQKALGVSVDIWGRESLQVRTPYTELLA
jgi:hypothetical protein